MTGWILSLPICVDANPGLLPRTAQRKSISCSNIFECLHPTSNSEVFRLNSWVGARQGCMQVRPCSNILDGCSSSVVRHRMHLADGMRRVKASEQRSRRVSEKTHTHMPEPCLRSGASSLTRV